MKFNSFSSWMVVCALITVASDFVDQVKCDFYLSESRIPSLGRAIVAGRNFQFGDVIDMCPTLVVKAAASGHWQLNNYVYASEDEDYSMLVFGIAMLFNHRSSGNETLHHYWHDYEVTRASDQKEPHSTYSTVSYKFVNTTNAGEEVFTTYGDNDWFNDRDIEVGDDSFVEPYDMEVLRQEGTCLSHVDVTESSLALAGKGLFAKKNFMKGEIVSISPVLLLPLDEVLETADTSLLINYVIAKPHSNVAILPIAFPVMANHQIKSLANMEVKWFNWGGSKLDNALEKDVKDLMASPFAPLDVQYIATRDISAGEELTLDYGLRWMASWSDYLAQRVLWMQDMATAHASGASEGDLSLLQMPMPIFRSPIEAPDDLFPSHWFDLSGEAQTISYNSDFVPEL